MLGSAGELAAAAGGFVVTFTRLAGLTSMGWLPLFDSVPVAARLALTAVLSLILQPLWPSTSQLPSSLSGWVGLLIGEMLVGILIGLVLAAVWEALTLAAQFIAVQAGFAFATTIDPSSEVDSGLLPAMLKLTAALIALAIGLDHVLIRLVASTLSVAPPGSLWLPDSILPVVLSSGSWMMLTAAKLCLPVITCLLLTDLALSWASRMLPALQLSTLAFPAKMLLSFALLITLVSSLPATIESPLARAVQSVSRILQH